MHIRILLHDIILIWFCVLRWKTLCFFRLNMSLVDYDSSDEEGTVYYPSEGEEIPPDSSSPQVGNLFHFFWG